MTFQQTIEFLYSQLPMFTRIGAAAYKKDLHNTIALLEAIGNPHHRFKSIHIAGTNGKGSTSHMLAAVFHANGYNTGLYTSPHLRDFRERIKTSNADGHNLEMVEESFVIDFTEKMKPVIAEIQPSFFELTVAMAFEYFAMKQVDIAVIETGLGGRLDSTNIILPELSVITNIGWDHMNILGDSIEKIAFEKAGIIKKNIPVVIGETTPVTKSVFLQKAVIENAPIHFAEEINIDSFNASADKLIIQLSNNGQKSTISTDLPGVYQQYNLRTAFCAMRALKQNGWQLSGEKIDHGLTHVKDITGLHGRWELIRKNPFVVLDVGHNEDGIRQVLNQIHSMKNDIENVHFITGMVKDKEVDRVLELLPETFNYYFTNAHIPRALPALELKQKAAILGLTGDHYEDVNAALQQALKNSSQNDLVLVCGSVFLVGEVEIEKFYSQELL